MSAPLRPYGLKGSRLPCPSPTPIASCPNSCPLSRWCHPTISSFVIPISSYLQSFLASRSFPVSQFFTSAGQSIKVSASASVLPMNIQDWFPLGLIDWISLQSKRLSGVFSNTTVQKHQFFDVQLSLYSSSHPYMTTGKTIALTRQTFFSKVMSLLFNMLSRLHTNVCVCCCLVTKPCLTLCNPMDYTLPGSSIHGIFQARILECVAIFCSFYM